MSDLKQVTTTTLAEMKRAGEKIVSLTAYDASFASLIDAAGVEVILVGDSLGMVVQGRETTIPVTLDEMIYHSRCAARGVQRGLLMVDLPFMSYATLEQALESAARLMKEGGAQMVKLEGGRDQVEVVRRLSGCGIPVCGHIGLQPQSVHKLGGYRVQGRESERAEEMKRDALALQEAGADALVMECVPASLAAAISKELEIPVIGIGAGVDCDGQVLVLHDLLGITPGRIPKFAHNFMADADDIQDAVAAYVAAVKVGEFPAEGHSF
ncbi:3-methyl-2-oxobutanoate hydroxymethyltransferase [Solemya pervernicosa gill symbiont]|uniref:3-methyl-2-oxobutanoate hydroxymethyltransferase n=2 Tax=Gammaproteobacteria incertae sedis TaxID=118884 RepID=A0A1T2L9X2_9GAMM|nr:3-methyl-2-oxobutanoate hydroxymethyltransferase [Candidatus Reidiella endopervernicosa]OOZ41812.1 3-methyl-2-oxobutanoate hydroxymethyltransferase [Solemya pervernicosa gill symbiont]QKQ26233.1 3-methyl-2-oxobutanoate hydroxymethyltransferase [Candidatus Reidiella endopervernicosa]